MKDLTITVNSFSKSYAITGWRLGYAARSAKIIAEMAKLALFQTSCPNSISQKVGVEALRGSQDCVANMLEEYERRRNFIVEGLNAIEGISCLKPGGTFYVFPNISNLMESSFDFSKFLSKKHGFQLSLEKLSVIFGKAT